jgi:formiminoglutamase
MEEFIVNIKHYNKQEIESLTRTRSGEKKWGESIELCSDLQSIGKSKAKYILLGVQDNKGVLANGGRPGTEKVWDFFLPYLLNLPVNPFSVEKDLCILGKLDLGKEYTIEELDQYLAGLVEHIIKSGKRPIIVGGGHNNSFPNIMGASKALKKPIDVVNIDAHADLRTTDGRNSGNGFSYAIKEKYLDNYFMLGLHKLYNNAHIIKTIDQNPKLHALFFEDMILNQHSLGQFVQYVHTISANPIGLEIDMDVVARFPSSAVSLLGFDFPELLQLIYQLTHHHDFVYYHICESLIGELEHNNILVAKSLCYIIQQIVHHA